MPLIPVGEQPITLCMLTFISVLGYVLIYFTGKLQRWMAEKLNKRPSLDYGTAQSITSILRYALIGIGFVIILQAAGIDLSTVTVMAGALGIGVGLGLQNIVSNLVSGLVVMFERPVKVGDRIEVGGVLGDVVKLSLRAATIRTNDNIEIIVPNNEFINGNVTNWSHSSRDVRLNIPVGVSYSSDPETVRECLLAAAEDCKMVLEDPSPDVIFDGFGDSALNFELRVYTSTHVDKPRVLKSALNFLIFQKLKEADIEIPFPQRDLHLKSGFLKEELAPHEFFKAPISATGKRND
ncbi:mechanosensitive ion channel [bacterium]|nr:mechanosensitive ion channel [bacterium]